MSGPRPLAQWSGSSPQPFFCFAIWGPGDVQAGTWAACQWQFLVRECAPLPPTCLGPGGATCLAVAALGCSRPPGEARISHRAGGTQPGVGVVTTHLTALEAEAPRA